MSRQTKTPRQRAEERHAIAKRRVEKLTKDHQKGLDDLVVVEQHLAAAKKRLAYVSADPDLADPVRMSLPVEGGGEE